MFNLQKIIWFGKPQKPQVTVATYKRKEVSRGLDSELHQALLADYIARRGHSPKGMAK